MDFLYLWAFLVEGLIFCSGRNDIGRDATFRYFWSHLLILLVAFLIRFGRIFYKSGENIVLTVCFEVYVLVKTTSVQDYELPIVSKY